MHLSSSCRIAAALVLTVVRPAAPQQSRPSERATPATRAMTASDWRSDLHFLGRELTTHHPKLASGPTRVAFDQALAELDRRAGALSRERMVMEIARVVALIRDGHTQINPANDDAIAFHRYPLRLYWYSDGIFVRNASPELARFAGARLLGVGGISTDSVVARLRPYIHGDNEMTVRDVLPTRLVLAEVLQMLGASRSADAASFRLQRVDGSVEVVTLRAIPTSSSATGWISARAPSVPEPLYLRNRNRTYWFHYLDSLSAMYVQFNAVADDSAESMATFCQRMFSTVDSLHAERLIIDLRLNNGGDNTLNRPCVHGLIRSTRVDQPGKLFVIVGRLTFSAAMNLAVDIERNSSAIFVGEPTGASPNHFGETRVITLPKSGITVLHSTLFWQSSDPRDMRPWIDPTRRAELSSEDFRLGRDPALASIAQAIHSP